MIAVRALVVLVVSMIAAAASAQELGRDYTRLTLPQAPGAPAKVEVLEFFSWGCSHCAEMHPLITEWEKQLPANAVVVKVPISLGHREWGQLVRAYYALEAMGELQRLDGAVFDAIHKERTAALHGGSDRAVGRGARRQRAEVPRRVQFDQCLDEGVARRAACARLPRQSDAAARGRRQIYRSRPDARRLARNRAPAHRQGGGGEEGRLKNRIEQPRRTQNGVKNCDLVGTSVLFTLRSLRSMRLLLVSCASTSADSRACASLASHDSRVTSRGRP